MIQIITADGIRIWSLKISTIYLEPDWKITIYLESILELESNFWLSDKGTGQK